MGEAYDQLFDDQEAAVERLFQNMDLFQDEEEVYGFIEKCNETIAASDRLSEARWLRVKRLLRRLPKV